MNAAGKLVALAMMFAAVPGMRDWTDHISPEEKQKLVDHQKKHYKLLLERKGVKEFYSRDLDVTVMARDQRNADRKFNNIRRALKDEKLL
jgi:hypothetical protein